MRRYRSYLAGEWTQGQTHALDESESIHLSRVLRSTEGLEIDLFNGRGRLGTAVLQTVGKKSVSVLIQSSEVRPHAHAFGLAVPQIKSPLFEDSLEQAVELGMTLFVPLETDRMIVRQDAARIAAKREKWERSFRERLKQCERLWEPEITSLQTLSQLLDNPPLHYQPVVLLERDEAPEPVDAVLKNLSSHPLFLIGPEGGWSAEERELFLEKAVYRIALPHTILRTETAMIACATLAAFLNQQPR